MGWKKSHCLRFRVTHERVSIRYSCLKVSGLWPSVRRPHISNLVTMWPYGSAWACDLLKLNIFSFKEKGSFGLPRGIQKVRFLKRTKSPFKQIASPSAAIRSYCHNIWVVRCRNTFVKACSIGLSFYNTFLFQGGWQSGRKWIFRSERVYTVLWTSRVSFLVKKEIKMKICSESKGFPFRFCALQR